MFLVHKSKTIYKVPNCLIVWKVVMSAVIQQDRKEEDFNLVGLIHLMDQLWELLWPMMEAK